MPLFFMLKKQPVIEKWRGIKTLFSVRLVSGVNSLLKTRFALDSVKEVVGRISAA
jgi:hypothetical protein